MTLIRPTFRNPEHLQVLPEREWLRQQLPSGREGFIAEDLDLVVRAYGPRYGLDALGRFRLIELKRGNASLGTSKRMTFGLIDQGLRTGATAERYDGYYVVRTSEAWDEAQVFNVNGIDLAHGQFRRWLQKADTEAIKPIHLDLR